eukprot:2135548-Pleurochrysis_carterae.AAC.1
MKPEVVSDALCELDVVDFFGASVAESVEVVHEAAKHGGGVVEEIRTSHCGRAEDDSNELEVQLALLDRAVGLGRCDTAELAEGAHTQSSIVKPCRRSGRLAKRLLVRQKTVSHCLDVELL